MPRMRACPAGDEAVKCVLCNLQAGGQPLQQLGRGSIVSIAHGIPTDAAIELKLRCSSATGVHDSSCPVNGRDGH